MEKGIQGKEIAEKMEMVCEGRDEVGLKRKTVHLIATQHLDIAWLWKWDPEGIELMRRCFEFFCDLIEKYPDIDFIFSRSTPLSFQAIEKFYPRLFERVKRHVASGKIELAGGEWVEPDHAIPGGESLVRQLLYGQRYFLSRFGKLARVAWAPDGFTHPESLPQIFLKAGLEGYYIRRCRPAGFKQFVWEGGDGSRIIVMAGKWIAAPEEEVVESLKQEEKDLGVEEFHLCTGLGSDRDIRFQEDWLFKADELSESVPEYYWKWSGANEVLERMKKYIDRLPLVKGELGYEFTGTFTTNGFIKRYNRSGETLLLDLEKLFSIAQLEGKEYPFAPLKKLWLDLCFNQFHDIICGTCVESVHEEAYELYRKILNKGEKLKKEAIHYLIKNIDTRGEGNPVVVFNTLSWERGGVVEIETDNNVEESFAVYNEKGHVVSPVQILSHGSSQKVIFIAEKVPSFGHRVFYLKKGNPPRTDLEYGDLWLENYRLRVEVDKVTGEVIIFDKELKKFLFRDRGNRLVAYRDSFSPPERQSWSIYYTGEYFVLDKVKDISLVEKGPVRASIRVVKEMKSKDTLPSSQIVQYIRVYSRTPCVEFLTEVDWNEEETMLKAEFPFALKTDRVVTEIPYGVTEREPNLEKETRSHIDPTEHQFAEGINNPEPDRPMQQWLDFSNKEWGVLIVNDGKYGYDASSDTVRLSLLRSPHGPVDLALIDKGRHVFRYALYPHRGDWREAEAFRKGYEFNTLLTGVTGEKHWGTISPYKSYIRVSPPNVIITAWKQEEDGKGFILRLLEVEGKSGKSEIIFSLPLEDVKECDLIEREIGSLPFSRNKITLDIKPFELKTLRINIYSPQGGVSFGKERR